MVKKKEEEIVEVAVCEVVPKLIPLSIDYGREDLNDMARKINEVIDYLNAH